MENTLQKSITIQELLDFCCFLGRNLLFVKVFESTMDSMRAYLGSFCPSALFCCTLKYVSVLNPICTRSTTALKLHTHISVLTTARAIYWLSLFFLEDCYD